MLAVCFLDCSTVNLTVRGNEHLENVRSAYKPQQRGASPQPNVPACQDECPDGAGGSATLPAPTGDRQVLCVCTDKAAAVYALPSHRQVYSLTISEAGGILRAEIINFKEGKEFTPCLCCYTSDGYVRAYSLPSLRQLSQSYFVAPSPLVEKTISFAHYGHALFFCNATEVQKFSLSAAFLKQLPEMQGSVFQVSFRSPAGSC